MTDTGKAFVPQSQDDDDANKEIQQHYLNGAAKVSSVAKTSADVTPHDSAANEYDALWIGIAGDIAVRLAGDSSGSRTFKNVPVGWFAVNTSLVLDTGTSASEIIGVTW